MDNVDPRMEQRDYLRRLNPAAYQGRAYVHWSMTMEDRKKGWLDHHFHWEFREALTHACFRYYVVCPVYCLMPDHFHLLGIGYHQEADQRLGIRFVRKQLNRLLSHKSCQLQKQPYDHVLNQDERDRDEFQNMVWYIRNNPVRAGLVSSEQTVEQYPFVGCLVPGYPEISIFADDYWERFWRTYEYLCENNP